MISSKADFFFFSPLESELEDVSFLLTEEDDDADAFRALAPRRELERHQDHVRDKGEKKIKKNKSPTSQL